ncbi:hypothetical protein AXG93_1175s1330 [Marchantia polymorpha subsp. ruderalis]|uniref:Uncharacterized protein n=1 Tax=Marchantia polymorpha subsp. ruderalis TaxID=1480154 RepID=A0A176VP02_MARPO|nr:hypothetical protein AXG93_1175s1330 [Marchantia polymorpha subsp. ruderalis]
MTVVAEEYHGVADTESSVVISLSVPTPLIWDMDRMYGVVKGWCRYQGCASSSISGGASSSVSEDTSGGVGATGADTKSGRVSIADGGMSGDASGVPLFSSIPEFFKRLRKNYSEAQVVQYWFRILDRELQRRVCDATLMSDASSTLSHVFALSKKIELNMVEERVMTSSFARDTTTTSRIPHSTAQSRPIGGGNGSRGV